MCHILNSGPVDGSLVRDVRCDNLSDAEWVWEKSHWDVREYFGIFVSLLSFSWVLGDSALREFSFDSGLTDTVVRP